MRGNTRGSPAAQTLPGEHCPPPPPLAQFSDWEALMEASTALSMI